MSAETIIELRKLADFIDADTYDECWEIKETARGKLLRQASTRLELLETLMTAAQRVNEVWHMRAITSLTGTAAMVELRNSLAALAAQEPRP